MHTVSFCADTSGCAYKYVEQPLMNLECDPYPNEELILNCYIQGPFQQAFGIVWYWKPRNNPSPQKLSPTSSKYDIKLRNRLSTANFRTHGSLLRVQQLNDSDAGLYYCRGNLSNGTLLSPSNKLFLANQSVYTHDLVNGSTCSDAQTTTVASCGSGDSATVSTTTPTLATASNGGTDPLSSSPPDNTYPSSLPTTVTLAPTSTVTPVSTPESNMLQVALYAVISVIVVFCAVIVTLAVTIVILYRRKRGHANLKKTAGMFVMAINHYCYYGDVCQVAVCVCICLQVLITS